MDPERIINNGMALLKALMVPGAGLAGVAAVLLYASGKATDSPRTIGWGKNAGVGAILLYGGQAAITLLQTVSTRLFGSGT